MEGRGSPEERNANSYYSCQCSDALCCWYEYTILYLSSDLFIFCILPFTSLPSGQQKPFKPVKLFSIDRVFRNETLDATHLAEFHQVEGVVADRNITLGHLLGTIKQFFRRLGIEQIRFKPAYNPYTEPSMEVFAYHPGLKKWVEVRNLSIHSNLHKRLISFTA